MVNRLVIMRNHDLRPRHLQIVLGGRLVAEDRVERRGVVFIDVSQESGCTNWIHFELLRTLAVELHK